MGVSVAICGQIRDPLVFMATLGEFRKLLAQGFIDEIIVSTWPTDSAGRPVDPTAPLFAGIDVIVNDNIRDPFRNRGIYFILTKPIYTATRAAIPGNWIFRTRPDMVLSFENLPLLFSRVMAQPEVSEPQGVLKRRMWVSHFELTLPFFIADFCFFAHAPDMLRLCEWDAYYEVSVPSLQEEIQTIPGHTPIGEIRRFLTPFVQHYPILHEYRDIWKYGCFGSDVRDSILEYNFSKEIWWEYFSVYLHILSSYFCIGTKYYDGDAIVVREVIYSEEQRKNLTISFNANWNSVIPGCFGHNLLKSRNHLGQVFCNMEDWLDDVLAGRIAEPFVQQKIPQFLERALNYKNTPQRRAAFADYCHGLKKIAGVDSRREGS
jgi:hypothetical protein